MIVEMKKLVLIGYRDERNKLLDTLHQSRLAEIVATRDLENTSRLDNTVNIESLNAKRERINFAFDFLKAQRKLAEKRVKETKKEETPYQYTPVKEPPFSSVARMNYSDFSDIEIEEEDLLAAVSDLESLSEKQNGLTSTRNKLTAENELLENYENLPLAFSEYKDTAKTVVIVGTVPPQRLEGLLEINRNDWAVVDVYEGKKAAPFVAVALKEHAEELSAALQELDYVKCPFFGEEKAYERKACNLAKIDCLDADKYAYMEQTLSKETIIRDLKTLYDFYFIKLAKYGAIDGFAATSRAFVLEAWYPAEQEERIKKLLDDTTESIVYEFREPEENEVVPTLVRSKKLVEPYEDITNMYSVPNYRGDFDPNPVMMFFYFLFFGMMVADAVYGLVLAIGGFVLYKVSKPVPGKGRLMLIIGMGGISTAIWGILFGSYLGFPTATMDANLAILFSPLDEPLYMLILCFALGFIQIVVGMALNAYNLIRKGHVFDAVSNVFSWFCLFIAVGLAAVGLLLDVPKFVSYIAIAFAALGVILLLSGGVQGKKGAQAVKGVIGRVAKLYDGVNILSDILSYSRLFGLGLSGGVVAMVVNMICEVVADLIGVPVLGYIICIPVYIVGHLFNIAISTLGAYVHNARLQYIEFYGKFYEGGGHQFVPFASQTKYTYIDMNSAAKDNNAA